MGDEDGVDQVKEEDDGVVALGGGRTCIYKGDVDGVGRVRKEGKGVKLGGGRTSEGFGGFVLKTIRGVLLVSASKPSEDGFLVWTSKPNVDSLVVWASKLSVAGSTGLGHKTGE
jgi:hypothetical protein